MAQKNKHPVAPDLKTLQDCVDDDSRNRLLLEWLKDDDYRADLFRLINGTGGSLDFPSADADLRDDDSWGLDVAPLPPRFDHRPVRLITDREQIQAVLRNEHKRYSNRVYAELGGGQFMLALESTADAHAAQRQAYAACFPDTRAVVLDLAYAACRAAAVVSLRPADFDLAAHAEHCALRFCQMLMGYAMADFRLLESALRVGYRALVYQVLGRHFGTDPVALPQAKIEAGRLLARTAALIDAYATNDEDALEGTSDRAVPGSVTPVLKALAGYRCNLNGRQRAVIALGAVIGTVGNVQAAVCIAMKAFFANRTLRGAMLELAGSDRKDGVTQKFDDWQKLIARPLAANPPIPFLPRVELDDDGNFLREVLLALGGGTRSGQQADDPLIWGLPYEAAHWCAGLPLAWPLIVEIVRQVVLLPGLEQRLDPEDASPIGLTKRWGFACERYPLSHQRDRQVVQTSLNVAMRLKSPVKDNADRVREVIRSGAPRIEEALRESRHVHFAWFELIESDTVLVLHTVYDGPFDEYIEHFALRVGNLFDELFKCIENPPPMPVNRFPNEFVAHIRRHDRPPAMGYFFSAYPQANVAKILRDELARL